MYCVFENKLIICSFGNVRYQISREKFEPEPELELGPPKAQIISLFSLNNLI